MRIYSDAQHNIAYIEGVMEGFTGAFTASYTGSAVSVYHSGLKQYQISGVPYTEITDVNGNGFADAPTLVSYLNNQVFIVTQNAGSTFVFQTPQTQWVINHNLGYIPQVNLYTMGGAEIEGDVLNTSTNQVQISFATATAGYARLF